MRKSKSTEEQIIGFLKQAEAGMVVAENAKLKHLLAEAHLDLQALKSVLGVKR
jgi:putative transposase